MNIKMIRGRMYRFAIPASLLVALSAMPVHAADMNMKMSGSGTMTTTPYRYELAGPIRSVAGKSIVPVRLMHEGKPILGAIVIQLRADMAPMGMKNMTAPIKLLNEKPPGVYRFEIVHGPVWKKPDNWLLTFSAKVQGVANTVNGNLIVKLMP